MFSLLRDESRFSQHSVLTKSKKGDVSAGLFRANMTSLSTRRVDLTKQIDSDR